MKAVSVDLSENIHCLEIHPFADLHIGDRNCNLKLIKERIELVKNNPNAFIVLNGDIINNATKSSVSDTYGEEMPPMEQLSRFIEVFEPVKDRILCATSGNHENRTYKQDGIDLTYLAMQQFGIADRYASEGVVLFVHFGSTTRHNSKVVYSIYATHGSGGGRRPGAKINRLEDMLGIVQCDCYIHSHTHTPIVFKASSHIANPVRNVVTKTNHLFVNTSAMLDYGGYGQAQEYKPSSLDSPIIYLYDGREKHMEARL